MLIILDSSDAGYCFNPRPREAGDKCHWLRCDRSPSFNPRPREAGDSVGSNPTLGNGVSIHARVKRATSLPLHAHTHSPCFNPRPREAGDGKITKYRVA